MTFAAAWSLSVPSPARWGSAAVAVDEEDATDWGARRRFGIFVLFWT